jgi:hypothetical protein
MRRAQAGWIVSGVVACAGLLVGVAAATPAAAEPAVTRAEAPANGVSRVAVRRGPTRLRVYRSFPGPNSVRQCEAHYEQEFRQAGTVIVPRVHCWWEG